MRKHALVALSAFTALGTSALARLADEPHPSLTALRHHFGPSVPARRSGVDRGRDLLAVHDPFRSQDVGLDEVTGLPSAPRARTARRRPAPTGRPSGESGATSSSARNDDGSQVPTPQPEVASATGSESASVAGGVWYDLRLCESGDNYAADTGNGYYGAYQFSLSTWESLGYGGLPSEASPALQDEAAAELEAIAGWDQWPQCAAELGL